MIEFDCELQNRSYTVHELLELVNKHIPESVGYCANTVNFNCVMLLPRIEKVIFNPPATIVFWDDGTKTVVKDTDGNWENTQKANKSKRAKKIKAWKEAGLLNAIAKKYYKNYQDDIAEWIEEA